MYQRNEESHQSIAMPDLHQLPSNIQLQIYDLLLAICTYQHQCRLDTICTTIKKSINQKADEESNDDDDYDEKLNISGIDEININDNEELHDSLPKVIRTGYNYINLIWDTGMGGWGYATLSKCSMSLLDDDETSDKERENIQVLKLYLRNDSFFWDAI